MIMIALISLLTRACMSLHLRPDAESINILNDFAFETNEMR